MTRYIFLLLALTLVSCGEEKSVNVFVPTGDDEDKEFITPFEKGNGNQTATYEETISFYQRLADNFSTVKIEEVGTTDSGKPLHLVTYSKNTVDWEQPYEDRIKILVNNGIHPGESDGIDATMMLMRDLAAGKIKAKENLIFSTIAIYNIGGSLNRNTTSRTNQNGPESYGFRGNARNFDLNRDFIKADTRNAFAFYEVFHKTHPDIFIDNHVSNGADYQYVLTHLFSQHSKMPNPAGKYIKNKLQPQLEEHLKKRDWDITPYVNVFGRTPDSGFSQFMDHPRYSTGYTALWNTLGLMVETHMLKPYKDRVQGTRILMEEMIALGTRDMEQIKKVRIASLNKDKKMESYPYNYVLDTTKVDTLNFKGYEGVVSKNNVTGNDLLTYDRTKPFTKKVPYYTYFKAKDSIKIPDYYIVPAGQWEVIDRMRANKVQMEVVGKDSTLKVNAYRIKSFQTSRNAYEGHYPQSNVEVEEKVEKLRFRESDILITTRQPAIRYIVETLEPQMADSFFKWNFFDTILQQKEGFSTYVFEQTAKDLLMQNESLKKEFDSLNQTDNDLARSSYKQLEWLHKRSPNYEKAHLSYPIYRYFKN